MLLINKETRIKSLVGGGTVPYHDIHEAQIFSFTPLNLCFLQILNNFKTWPWEGTGAHGSNGEYKYLHHTSSDSASSPNFQTTLILKENLPAGEGESSEYF